MGELVNRIRSAIGSIRPQTVRKVSLEIIGRYQKWLDVNGSQHLFKRCALLFLLCALCDNRVFVSRATNQVNTFSEKDIIYYIVEFRKK